MNCITVTKHKNVIRIEWHKTLEDAMRTKMIMKGSTETFYGSANYLQGLVKRRRERAVQQRQAVVISGEAPSEEVKLFT